MSDVPDDRLDPLRDDIVERAVVGTVLAHPDEYQAFHTLQPDDFAAEHWRECWRSIVVVAINGVPQFDAVRVDLQNRGRLSLVGLPRLMSTIDGMPRPSLEYGAFAMARLTQLAQARRFRTISEQTIRQLEMNPTLIGNGLLPHHLEELEALQQQAAAGRTAGAFPATWQLLNDVELLELSDPEFLVEGIIPKKGIVVPYGPSGSGKTTLIASLGVSLATGRDWFGHRVTQPCAGVYVATEDAPGFKVRLSAAKRAARLSLTDSIGIYTFPEPIDLRDPISVGRFTQFLRATRFAQPLGWIAIDTYAGATPGAAENSSEDTTLAMTHAHRWRADLDVTVLLAHHTNAGGSRERGHTGMRGAADTMISVTPVDDAIHVECSKQRNATPFQPLILKLVPLPDGGCVLRLASDVLPSHILSPAQQKILSTLQGTFASDGATKSEWQRACDQVAERTFHRAAKVLLEQGKVKLYGSHFRAAGGAA